MESGQFSAAIAAIKEMGVLSGQRIERKEVGPPGAFDALTDDELEPAVCERFSPNITIVEFGAVEQFGGATKHPALTHGKAAHFERGATAAEIDAVAEEVLTAERKPDAKRPGEATGVVLTVTVSPHRRIEHRA
jgi:hypothetical protein